MLKRESIATHPSDVTSGILARMPGSAIRRLGAMTWSEMKEASVQTMKTTAMSVILTRARYLRSQSLR